MHGTAPLSSRAAWPRAARVLGILLGLILLLTGVTKLLDLPGFAAIVGTYQVLPETLRFPAALAIMGIELVLGVCLLIGWQVRLAAGAALLLHLSYTGWSLLGVLRGLQIPNCGCFGVFWPRPLGWSTVGEDVALSVLCGITLLIAPRPAVEGRIA